MKKAGRVLLITVGAVLGMLAVMLLAVNLYVQSEGTQARIQQELSQRLGAELRIERISVTPWWGLRLSGITMPQSDAAAGDDFLQADTFRLRIRFVSLFSRRLVIKEVALVRPNVHWVQNSNGKWRLPTMQGAVDESTAEPPPPVAGQPAQPPTGTAAMSPAAPSADVRTEPAPGSDADSAAFTPEVRRVTLTGGDFHFLDMGGKPVATFEGVDFRSSLRSGAALRGNVTITRIALRDRFFLEQLDSPLRYDPSQLEFSQITARAAGGEITGFFSMKPADPGSPFDVNVKFREVDADKVVTNAGGPSGMINGRIEGELEATGKTADPNALGGAGEIYLRDGEVRQYSLLVALGRILQIDELTQLRFEEAHVKYHITPGVIIVDEMLLSSANLRLSAKGTISFQGKMRMDSQLAINDKIRRQLFRAIGDNFQPLEQPGYYGVDFRIHGTVDKPKSNLMNRLVGSQL
ncbi:MAG: AsmA family protein, partial [Chthoniobacterales bacterium]|nr:AsmA family protein [Chthoniobacterales bacterium]